MLSIFSLTIHLLLSTIPKAQAEIVFVDVNDSQSEIKAARLAAKERGEELIVIPEKRSDKTPLEKQLKEKLDQLVKDKKSLSALIISGHYSKSRFYGEKDKHLSLSFDQVSKLMENPDYKEMRENVSDLLLWGCYSARPKSLADWQALFPNLTVLAGFNFAAPKSQTLASPGLMSEILKKSKSILEDDRWEKAITSLTKTLNYIYTSSVIVVRNCYYSSQLGALELEDIIECPPELIEKLIARKKVAFDPYLKASKLKEIPEELKKSARSHGPSGLYRFKVDCSQYQSCFSQTKDLPSKNAIANLCQKFHCD